MSIREPFPSPVKLPFGFKRRDAPITLHRGLLKLCDGGTPAAEGMGRVLFEWLPQPGVRFVLPDQYLGGIAGAATLEIPSFGVTASVVLTSWNPSGGEIRGVINRSPFPETSGLRELCFLVPNYLFMTLGQPLEEHRQLASGGVGQVWTGRTVIEGEGWELTLDERPDGKDVKKRLRTRSGHEVTHTARLRRADGAAFTDAVARDRLLALAHFFGLTCGLWAPPLLAVGYDESGRIVWRDWSPPSPSTSPWRGVMNVIDVYYAEALKKAFAGFMHAWEREVWREPLVYATQMYVEANGPVFAETSLVLTQAALELIAWVRIVEEEESQTEPEFNKLRASDRIRKLLEWLELDSAIPEQFAALRLEAARLGWVDGPHAIDAMRNALVHPRQRERIENTDLYARIELHELSLWYVELALLRAIGFDGQYSSRLGSHTSGYVELVPWARPRSGGGSGSRR